MSLNIIKNYKKDKDFHKKLFKLTLPIVLQSLVTSSLNMLDTLMIGKVGETELAAVGIANQYYFLFTLFVLGISGGGSVLIAQLWGKNDKVNIKKVLSKTLMLSFTIIPIFVILGLVIPDKIISIFNSSTSVVTIGRQYLVITVISYIFTGISFVFASSLRSIGNTRLPMAASLLGLTVNAFLNYCLIFGHYGMPELKTQGAAYATLIARICECLLILFVVYFKDRILNIKLCDFRGLSDNLKKTLTKITVPIVINETTWGVGNVTYMAIYSQIGTGATASIQICSAILNLFLIFSFGLSYSSLVVVGNEIGSNNEESAKESSKKIAKVSVILALFISIILFVLARPIVSFFNISDDVKLSATYILYVYSSFMTMRVFNMVMIVGIFRGGGDATYSSTLQACTLWLIGIPLAALGVFVFKLPIYIVVSFTAIEEITKFFFMMKRFKSYKWIKNMVKDYDDEDPNNSLSVAI